MCTPERLRDNCSCPHLAWNRLAGICRAASALAAGGLVWLVFATGYWWTLIVVAWLVVMGAVGLAVRRHRRRGVLSPLLVRRYGPEPLTREAGAIRGRTAGSPPPATAPYPRRTTAPGAAAAAQVPARGTRQ